VDFVESGMAVIAPNLSALIGTSIAAQLMSAAGGLEALAQLPPGAVARLGANRRALTGFSGLAARPTLAGYLNAVDMVALSPTAFRSRVLRILSAKCALAARVDCHRERLEPIATSLLSKRNPSNRSNQGSNRHSHVEDKTEDNSDPTNNNNNNRNRNQGVDNDNDNDNHDDIGSDSNDCKVKRKRNEEASGTIIEREEHSMAMDTDDSSDEDEQVLLASASPELVNAGTVGRHLREEIARKLEKWQEPPPPKLPKPLPAPDDRPRKRRGGRRVRKLKEKFAMTEMRKQANRMQFGIEEQKEFRSTGATLGMLGMAGGTGKLRLPVVDKGILKKQKQQQQKAYGGSSGNTSGLSSSLAFTPVQGLELSNPEAAAQRIRDANQKYFGDRTPIAWSGGTNTNISISTTTIGIGK